MAYKTPQWFLDLDRGEVQAALQLWIDGYRNHYQNTNPRNIKRFNPNDYDLECVRLDSINHSFILTKWGYAINFTKFCVLRDQGFTDWSSVDGVFYPARTDRHIPIMGMHGKNKKKNGWDYKELCDKYLRSSYEVLSDVAHKKTHPFTNFM